MIINLVVAGIAGVALPLLLDRMKIDPAVARSFCDHDYRCGRILCLSRIGFLVLL